MVCAAHSSAFQQTKRQSVILLTKYRPHIFLNLPVYVCVSRFATLLCLSLEAVVVSVAAVCCCCCSCFCLCACLSVSLAAAVSALGACFRFNFAMSKDRKHLLRGVLIGGNLLPLGQAWETTIND